MSRVTTSTSSTADSTKKVNVKLNAVQKKQFDIIAELKPEWTVDDIYQFCQRHEFDSDKLQSSLDSTFEFDNTQTDDNWMSIQKKPTSKQSVTDGKSSQSTSGGPKQKFDRTQRPDRANKPSRTKLAAPPAGGDNGVTGDVEESKAAEADGATGDKKPFVKRERKPFNKDRPAVGADGAQQTRKPYNREGQQQQQQQQQQQGQRGNKGGKRDQQQQAAAPAEPKVPLPKPGISFLSALNTGLTKPQQAPAQPAQPTVQPSQQQHQTQSADQTQAFEPAAQTEHKEEQKAPAVDPRRQKELEQKAHEDSVLAARMAAVPQPRGVWKKRTPQEIEAEQAAQREAEQQRQQAEAAASQQHVEQPAEEPVEEQQQHEEQPADAGESYEPEPEPEQSQLEEQFNDLNVQQPLSPQHQQQQYSAIESPVPQGQMSPEPTTVPQPLAHQPLPVSSAFSSAISPSAASQSSQQQQQQPPPQSHSIFGSYQPGIRSVNELLSQNDPVILPRHIQNATQQQSYPNISFGAFNMGNRQPKDLSVPQQPQQQPIATQSVSPQPAQKSVSPAPPQQAPASYAAASSQQTQQQAPPSQSSSRFGAGLSSALSPLLPSSAADSTKQPSAEPHQQLDYAGADSGEHAQNVYNQYDEPQHGYQAHYPQQYGQQQYEQPNNYYSAQSYGQPQYEDNTYGGYNDQYRPKSGNKPNANVNKQPIGPNARSQQPGGKMQGQQAPGQQQYRPQQYDQYGNQGSKQSYQQRQGGPQGYQQPQQQQQYAPVNKPAQSAVGQPAYNANKSFNKPGPQQQQPAYQPTQPYQYNLPAPYSTPLYQYGQQPMYSPYSQYQPQYPAQVPPGFRQQQPYYPAQPYQQPYQSQYQPPQQYSGDDQQQPYGSPNSAAGQPHTGNEYSKQSPESGTSSGRNTGAPQDSGVGGYEQQPWHKDGQHQPPQQYQQGYGAPQQAYNNQYGQQQPAYGRQQQYGGEQQQQGGQQYRPTGQWPQSQQ